MRITLITIGSRGDVEPFVALGKGLSEAGFRVCLASHERFRAFVTAYGLEFRPVAGDPREILQKAEGQTLLAGGRSFLRFLWNLRQIARPYAGAVLADSLAACADADLIIYGVLAFTGYHLGEYLGVPALPALLQPAGRTRAFPVISLPAGTNLGGPLNYLSHALAEQFFWQAGRPVINPWRQQLGLRRLPLIGPYRRYYQAQRPFLYGFSPLVVPKPADWYEAMSVTGYWFLPPLPDWQPPARLTDFLAAGPPPIYFGFGSMTDREPAELMQLTREALTRTGQRGVVLTGWGGLDETANADDLLVIDEVPHRWLFPRMKMVIHHGGAGTTAAGLRAGVPTIVIPYFADQPFWGERLETLGVAPAPIPRRALTAEKLAAAIQQVLADEPMQARAASLGRQIAAEDGVGNAVRFLQQTFA